MTRNKLPPQFSWLKRIVSFGSKPTHSAAAAAAAVGVQEESEQLLGVHGGARSATVRTKRVEEKVEAHRSLSQQIGHEMYAFFFTSRLNVLLVFLPVAFVSKYMHWGDGATFVFSMLALTPLAERLGFVTEQLAMYTNDTLGGLINATFGNATEVIISGFALKQGLLRVVQLALLGSVISNLLLVMGSAFIVGGISHSTQSFNQQGVSVNCGLLTLAVVAVLLPSLLSETHTLTQGNESELMLSRFESVLLLACYVLFLVFQLFTHRHLYEDDDSDDEASNNVDTEEPDLGRGAFGSLMHSIDDECLNSIARQVEALPPTTLTNMVSQKRNWNSPGSLAGEEDVAETSGYSGSGGNSKNVQMMRLSRSNTPLRREAAAAAMLEIEENHSLNTMAVDHRDPAVKLPRSNTSLRRAAAAAAAQAALAEIEENHSMNTDSLASGLAPGAAIVTKASLPNADDDEKELSIVGSFIWLTLSTAIIALLSMFIVDAIKGASLELNIPLPFLVTIVLPIVGNAAEHASALIFAWRKKMEIALGVAVGSSIQISVLVVPFCVVLAWIMGQPLDLNFNAFEAAVLFLSVLIASIVLQDGRSNWIKGVMLLLTYAMVAAGFWFHKDSDLSITDVDAA